MTKYDERFKLSVVRQYLDNQGGYTALAKQHGLERGMLRRWVKWFNAYGDEAFQKKFTHYSGEFKLSVPPAHVGQWSLIRPSSRSVRHSQSGRAWDMGASLPTWRVGRIKTTFPRKTQSNGSPNSKTRYASR
jgi:transposase-like protein